MKFASKLYVGAAATALCMAAFPAAAQIEAPQDDNAATTVEEIVVTGSRIRRSGVQTPTPTTIINAETIRRSGVSEIADLVNEIPSLFVSQNNQTSNQQGNAGLNRWICAVWAPSVRWCWSTVAVACPPCRARRPSISAPFPPPWSSAST